jgi:hypothetical protein
MAVETHAIIMTEGEDVINELHMNMREGNLLTNLNEGNFKNVSIKNLKYIRIADPQETDHHDRKSIWVEITISF